MFSFSQIWDILTGELLHFCSSVTVDEEEPTHGGWGTDLSFSPDSKMLVSSGGYLKVSLEIIKQSNLPNEKTICS